MANKSLIYHVAEGKSIDGLIYAITNFLQCNENMEVQQLEDNLGSTILQARSVGGKFKQFAGLDKGLSIKLTQPSQTTLLIEVGEARWVDKGAAMAVGTVLLPPLAFTSGFGIYKQAKLPSKLDEVAKRYLYF